jgi:predicted ATPase/DNA-binding SARP family transcriptional activator
MLTVSVLGPLEVTRAGARIAVPSGKTSEVLIRLALEAGTLVRFERLIDDLWGAAGDTAARNTLQTKVSRLRRALGDPALVEGGRIGYLLRIDPSAVDALAAPQLAAASAERSSAGDHVGALAQADQALALFRGEILRDAGDGDWLIPHRVKLEAVRLGLIESRLGARIRLGGAGAAGAVVGELQSLVADYPLRESLWALLITALYRDQRQAEALAAYRTVRERLADELGLDPGPELRALEQQVLHHDERLDAPAAVATGPAMSTAPTAPTVTGNVPTLSARLFGRAGELRELSAAIDTQRLVTLVGPAGVGKTRLAIEVARAAAAPDGSWLVRLENVRTPATLAQTIGEAFGIGGATEALVHERLQATSALVVLDNCEHLIDEIAELTARLLDAAPHLRVLATSQVPLNLDGEFVVTLAPLALADSVALFAHRATERRQSFVLDPDSESAIEDVCRSLDGLPLAIELAAARTRALSVQEIARRLDDRFGLLSDPTSRHPQRHRALATAIAWSYDLLFPDEQRGLWALACFDGGAPLDAAEHVAAALGVPAAAALDGLGRLADRSLVAVDIGEGGSVRYRLLDSVRAFASLRLREAGDEALARQAHCDWFAAAADRARADDRGPRLVEQVRVLRTERANIDAALTWAAEYDPPAGVRLALGFGWISVILGDGAVAAQRLRDALAAAGEQAPLAERAIGYAYMCWDEAGADLERARREGIEAMRLGELAGDPNAIAESTFALAFALVQSGQPRAVLELLDTWWTRAVLPVSDWPLALYSALVGLGAAGIGDIERIRTACAALSEVRARIDNGWLDSQAEAILSGLALAEGRFDAAAAHLEQAAAAADAVQLPATSAYHLSGLGRVLQLAGRPHDAVVALERAIAMGLAVGLMRIVAFSRVRLGRTLLDLNDRDAARTALTAADAWFAVSGGGSEAALAEALLIVMDEQDGSASARSRLDTALVNARADDNREVEELIVAALAARA